MAARAIWKGVIQFDGAEVPVKLYSAVQDQAVHFNLLHDQDMVRLKQRMVNAATGREVPYAEAKKGYEVEPGRFVLLNKQELEQLEPRESRTIQVVQCVDLQEVGQQWYDRPYYLGPDGSAENYWAMIEALERQKKLAIVRWVMRKKQYAGALRPERGHLMLITMRSPAEVVDARELRPPGGRKMDQRELRMAQQLVEALQGAFEPGEFHNEYVERVRDLVRRKARGECVETPKVKAPKPKKESLEAVLKASLDSVKREKTHAG